VTVLWFVNVREAESSAGRGFEWYGDFATNSSATQIFFAR
jgi:hypothetical protein